MLIGPDGWGWQRVEDGLHHTVEMAIDVRIPEPENAKPFAAQECVTLLIGSDTVWHPVLAAVRLDDDLCAEADEIDNVATDRGLSAEVIAARLQLAELHPQPGFLRSEAFAEGSGGSNRHG